MVLSKSAAAAVFDQALRDQTGGGRRGPLAQLAGRAGYRRRLRRRFADWTAAESRPAGSDDEETIAAAERATFRRYRRLLTELDAEDAAGLAVWASLRLCERPRHSADGDHLVFWEFDDLDGRAPARWRILEDVLKRPRLVDVTLRHDGDPDRAELFLASAAVRDRLLEMGLVETVVPADPNRPAGLRALDATLFKPGAPLVEDAAGLSIQGGPAGIDLGRMVAREANGLLDSGVPPDDVLIVFPSRDEQSEAAVEALRAAGIAVADSGAVPLDRDPAVAATLQTARLPLEDWEVDLVVRLLRNGRFQPDWKGADDKKIDRLAPAEAASILQRSPVFRGKDRILAELARVIALPEEGANEAETKRRQETVARARRAHPILKRLIETVDVLNRPRPWVEHAAGLRRAVESLGFADGGSPALETLWDALDDRAEVRDRLGRGAEATTWANFVEELTDVAAEVPRPRSAAPPGSIRTAAVDEADGARAPHVLVVGLTEGSFPRRDAVRRLLALKPGEAPDDAARLAYSAEALRFARLLGAAEKGASLFHPTTDAKGQPLLRAGFLDDLLNALAPAAKAAAHVAHARFHPALLGRDDLALAPADARALALARAAESGRLGRLRALARDPVHREPLQAAAAALEALQSRRKGAAFGPFDGMLQDPALVARIAADFGPEKHVFSPSQLETYLNCPFQFFCRHVLKLEPIDEPRELDEDLTERGSVVHDVLEAFEKLRAASDGSEPDEALMARVVDRALPRDRDGLGDLEAGFREIERGQVERTVAEYLRQRVEYRSGPPAVPTWFEYAFGEPETDHPEPFELRLGDQAARLKGRIDRIDVLESSDGPRFRVIDYKSGSPPSGKDVTEFRMLQLPLYAMAVERFLFEGGRAGPRDVGYWGLKEKGYKPIAFEEWSQAHKDLLERVFAVVRAIRAGAFPIAPSKHDCEKYCEYRSVCRIRQVRKADKKPPPLDAPVGDPAGANRS